MDDYLNIGKELYKSFLNMPMDPTNVLPFVQHPIFETCTLYDEEGLFDALQDKERYKKFKNILKKDIDECDNLSSIVNRVKKSYRLTYISFLWDYGVDRKICGNLLSEQWTSIETLTYDVNVKPRKVLSIIKNADKEHFMDEKELEIYNNLPDELTIYRGCRTKGGVKACSWTLSKEQAKWFANRFTQNGYVFMAKIKKQDVIAYKGDRNEKEIVADYTKLYDVVNITY
jgi:hypothetical protein